MKSYADFLLHPLRFRGSKSLATTCDFFTSILYTAQFGFLENRTKRQQRTRPRGMQLPRIFYSLMEIFRFDEQVRAGASATYRSYIHKHIRLTGTHIRKATPSAVRGSPQRRREERDGARARSIRMDQNGWRHTCRLAERRWRRRGERALAGR